MELSLDIQVDPATKKILSNPEKCKSALLDVTIVKPTDPDVCGHTKTTTLRADQVRRMIGSLEKERKEKQKLLDNLKNENTLVKIRKHDVVQKIPRAKTRIESSSPIDDVERKDFIGIGESVEPLFCEIRRSLKNVETRITNMQDINLVISQTTVNASTSEEFTFYKKKQVHHIPSATSLIYRTTQNNLVPDLKSVLRCKKTKSKEDKTEGKCLCENCGVVGLLMECQRHPLLHELREAPPPEAIRNRGARAFKTARDEHSSHIQQLNKRIKLLEQRLAEQELNSVPKDYFNRFLSKIQPRQQTSEYSLSSNNKTPRKPRLINSSDEMRSFRNPPKSNFLHKNQHRHVKHEATTTEDDAHAWRWGEEILKPGIDLKNRILNLVTDILSKFVITEKQSDNKITAGIGSRKSSPVTVKQLGLRSSSPLKHNPYTNRKPAYRENRKKCEEEMNRETAFNLDVSYVNPRMNKWKNEHDEKSSAKEEFYRVISRAKPAQREVLWRNIWNQAKANGQTKDDKITIKIPISGKGNPDLFETELTIREVEEILTKDI